jgi:hypothetical protein
MGDIRSAHRILVKKPFEKQTHGKPNGSGM